MLNKEDIIKEHYKIASEQYAQIGVNTEDVLKKLDSIPLSIHCWQGDDVRGFENGGMDLTGGIQSTGNYMGRARNPKELREDIEKAFTLIPGTKRLNLHAMYLETDGKKVDRNEIEPKYYRNWVQWAKENKVGLDFNATIFSHPKTEDGFTLSHPNKEIRDFWIEHVKRCRKISEYFGRELGTPSVMDIWIPDGFKDITVDRLTPRIRLKEALDECLSEKIDKKYNLDAVESKLFGIGSEDYVVGSHEFYMGYAIKNNLLLCLDSGHFHPTEVVSNKISAALLFLDGLLLHVSRPVRWDSDHVVILDGELEAIAQEIVRNNLMDRVHIGLDFFDGSINRIAAWAIGSRNMMKALTKALLEPIDKLKKAELDFDFTSRLAILEELKTYPWEAVWDYYCYTKNVPVGLDWLSEVKDYERKILINR